MRVGLLDKVVLVSFQGLLHIGNQLGGLALERAQSLLLHLAGLAQVCLLGLEGLLQRGLGRLLGLLEPHRHLGPVRILGLLVRVEGLVELGLEVVEGHVRLEERLRRLRLVLLQCVPDEALLGSLRLDLLLVLVQGLGLALEALRHRLPKLPPGRLDGLRGLGLLGLGRLLQRIPDLGQCGRRVLALALDGLFQRGPELVEVALDRGQLLRRGLFVLSDVALDRG
mmetsp:Transcript_68743/g.194762  ORF Transcript_68743/g.194762 Transcript_68743/m.194762 type:complete len:225 (-) Transcript_68743:514-1188(-)